VDLKPLNDNAFVIQNAGWGEIALFYALAQPDKTIYAVEDDEEKQTVAKIAAESIAPNINFVNSSEIPI
jgi:precorrin-6B methylase 2